MTSNMKHHNRLSIDGHKAPSPTPIMEEGDLLLMKKPTTAAGETVGVPATEKDKEPLMDTLFNGVGGKGQVSPHRLIQAIKAVVLCSLYMAIGMYTYIPILSRANLTCTLFF